MRRISYGSLLRQRMVVAALTLGLITAMIGVGIDIYLANTRTTIPNTTRALTEPLDPQLNIETVVTLESYETVTVESAKIYVRDFITAQQAAQQQEEADVQEALQDLGLINEATNSAEAPPT